MKVVIVIAAPKNIEAIVPRSGTALSPRYTSTELTPRIQLPKTVGKITKIFVASPRRVV
jgi:hypothetical protein